jgi:ribonuclease BN (tRNA processing enzyme)
MIIKFIGTGSGQTSLKRFHSSILIQASGGSLLIDTGDGVSRALMSLGIDFNTIDGILYTHMHPDHAAGLPSLIVQLKMLKRKKELVIYCHPNHVEQLTGILNFMHIYPERLEFPLKFITLMPDGLTETGWGIKFKSELNHHLMDLEKNPKGITPVSCGYLFHLKDKKVFYTGDIGEEEDLYKFSDDRKDIIIAESTHIPLDKIKEAFIKSGADRLYLTHIAEDSEIPETELNEKILAVSDGYEINL